LTGKGSRGRKGGLINACKKRTKVELKKDLGKSPRMGPRALGWLYVRGKCFPDQKKAHKGRAVPQRVSAARRRRLETEGEDSVKGGKRGKEKTAAADFYLDSKKIEPIGYR